MRQIIIPVVLLLTLSWCTDQLAAQANPPDQTQGTITISDVSGVLVPHSSDASKIILKVNCKAEFLGRTSIVPGVIPHSNHAALELWVLRGYRTNDWDPEGPPVPWYVKVASKTKFEMAAPDDHEEAPYSVPDITFETTLASIEHRFPAGGTIKWQLRSNQTIVWVFAGAVEYDGPTIDGSNSYDPVPGFDPGDGYIEWH